jgi:ferredoxin-NADP reductase/nitrite reductase/ring-hydroxylating ferredoxin subunit
MSLTTTVPHTGTSPLTTRAWHPVAASDDAARRHVFQGELHGRELAIWRADDGFVNVWENRCLHRGVRLSIGVNDGRELRCQYHGWRYSTRTAACTYIPAHPADAPARTISNRTYPVVERYGLIWTTLDDDRPQDVPDLSGADRDVLVLRAVEIAVPASSAVERLRTHGAADGLRPAGEDDLVLRFRGDPAVTGNGLTLFVQPAGATRCVVRGVLQGPGPDHLDLLRRHNRLLTRARARIEADLPPLPRGDQEPAFSPLPPELAELPPARADRARGLLRVRVDAKWRAGDGVAGFALAPLTGVLPTAQPGAHIDVHLPDGSVRQYSIVNAPGEDDRYIIGVKREPDSRGGSERLHEVVREGDVLAVSEPRNNFPLRRDADRTLLVAGGIGVTPLLAMAQALRHQGLEHELHYFGRSEEHLAFPDRLAQLGDAVRRHCGLDPGRTRDQLTRVLGRYEPGRQVYVCGPGPMIEAVRELSAAAGWPVEKVHFEYFRNTREIDKSSTFEVALARSCLTVEVGPGQTVLAAIRGAGVELPSSCEQGACGTCLATVVEGTPVHQDVYLNEVERASGESIITCVSRCSSPRLVLDL